MRAILIVFCLLSYSTFSQQNDFNVWASVGADGKVVKGLKWNAGLNSRFDDQGLKTFFPEVGLEYKLLKWLRPGIEYRFVTEKNDYDNYKPSSSLRINLTFRETLDRLKMGARLRYQNSFDHSGVTSYDDDFDQAIRFKPFLEYDINDFILTPNFSAEFFYNPVYGELTPSFTKIRYAIGADLDLNSEHNIGFKYRLDHRLNRYPVRLRHIVSVSYSYSF